MYALKKKKIKLTDKKPHVLVIKKIKQSDILDDNLLFKKKYSPLSGSELKYMPELWNDNNDIRTTHNCYTYALGKIVPGLRSKAQPGYASGHDHIEDNQYRCKFFFNRLKKDAPGSYVEKFDNKCLPGFYKIFLALDVGNDYHWWRENSDLSWSHKPGASNVVDVDADGKKIYNPLIANRNYDSLNYSKPCFFACIYSDLARSLNNIYY
jgi:hypothetical protein